MQANELTADRAQTAEKTAEQSGERSTRDTADADNSTNDAGAAALRVEYRTLESAAKLPAGLLAAVRFGHAASGSAESTTLCVDVGLEPLSRPVQTELWWAKGPVEQGRVGVIRYARDDHHLFAVIELDEREHGGIRAAAEAVYAEMRRFQQQSAFPHLLRIWNYFDAINEGADDLERYRQFCVGRTRGLDDVRIEHYPAATAIGRQHSSHYPQGHYPQGDYPKGHDLQVYWLASRTPGKSIENPRQVSAYRYPRTHGPTSPTFARATLAADGTLLVSGTASIVGHVSQHGGDPLAQLDETLRNLSMLSVAAHGAPAAAAPADVLFKVYVRDAAQLDVIASRLRKSFPHSHAVFLAADICRRELLLEIECVQLVAK